MPSIIESARLMQDELVSLRRHLHANPELSFCEYETAHFVAERLTALGYSVQTEVGKTGVIAERGGGSTIAIRCDMDALPIAELNRSVFTSKVPGVMHACGHDAHVACVLGAAKLLSQLNLPGRVRIIFQPGEECEDETGKSGASRMIEFGALDDVLAIIGLHVDATIPANKVGIVAGPVMPGVQNFVITVNDTSGEGEESQTSLNCANIVVALYDLAAAIAPGFECGISVRSINTSSNHHLRAEVGEATITGILKTYTNEMREKLQLEILNICSGLSTTVEFHQTVPETVNNPAITAVMHKSAVEIIGASNVLSIKRRSWAAEFSLYTETVPGAFMFLGAEIASSRRSHHSPTFDIDEGCLHVGAAILAETAFRLMQGF